MRRLLIFVRFIAFVTLQTVSASYAMEQEENAKITQPYKKQKILSEGTAFKVLAVVMPEILEKLDKPAQFFFVSLLPCEAKRHFRLTSKAFRNFIDFFFFGPVYDPAADVQAFSSERGFGTIGSHILTLLSGAKKQIVIASDKCTNAEFLDDLLELRQEKGVLDIKIVTGGDDGETKTLLRKPKYQAFTHHSIASNKNGSGKMHNKFIVIDNTTVLTGSPNMTYAAYNYNVESFIAIRHGFVAGLYLRYYDYIISGNNKHDVTQKAYQRVKKMLEVFNDVPNNPIQIALAPILDIRPFVIKEIAGKKLININMFLVSYSNTKPDIIGALEQACGQDTKIKIRIKVDEDQYNQQPYMQKALKKLYQTYHQEIYTVSKKSEKIQTKTRKIMTIPQFHDKLVLMKGKDGTKMVYIGSAGFTDNVQKNLNLENMVLLRGYTNVYKALLGHFKGIRNNNNNLTVRQLK